MIAFLQSSSICCSQRYFQVASILLKAHFVLVLRVHPKALVEVCRASPLNKKRLAIYFHAVVCHCKVLGHPIDKPRCNRFSSLSTYWFDELNTNLWTFHRRKQEIWIMNILNVANLEVTVSVLIICLCWFVVFRSKFYRIYRTVVHKVYFALLIA